MLTKKKIKQRKKNIKKLKTYLNGECTINRQDSSR
jgi:hypothetical protein